MLCRNDRKAQLAKRKVSNLFPLSDVVAKYAFCSSPVIDLHLRSRALHTLVPCIRQSQRGSSILVPPDVEKICPDEEDSVVDCEDNEHLVAYSVHGLVAVAVDLVYVGSQSAWTVLRPIFWRRKLAV